MQKVPLKTGHFRPFAGKCKGFAKECKVYLADYQPYTMRFAFLHLYGIPPVF
jgi:hypothetical protein